ncbi:MAG: arsenate reductase ArsC [Candidatus Coatesbacteria bacterium]|nr:arsenate reductase ArsC [Candidatus Coatesbacteria bacterium]
MAKQRILFLCTGNSARSQMAEALLRDLAGEAYETASAGTHPAETVHPLAVEEMARRGLDIAGAVPKHLDDLPDLDYDLVVTVCDRAKEECPFLPGARMLHWSFPDPAAAEGDLESRRSFFREVADDIRRHLEQLTA